MDIRKFIIIVCLLISLPVQAQQFKQFGSEIINKQAVTHVKMTKSGVNIYYGAGSSSYESVFQTCIVCKTAQERNQKFKEINKWLNERN